MHQALVNPVKLCSIVMFILMVARIFPKELIRNLVMTKRQEVLYMNELSPEERVEIYLDTV